MGASISSQMSIQKDQSMRDARMGKVRAMVLPLTLAILVVGTSLSPNFSTRAARSITGPIRGSIKTPEVALITQTFNGKIAFYTNRDSLGLDIHSINPDGSSQTKLTDDVSANPNQIAGTYDTSPAWSPDGTRLAFVSNRDAVRFQIYVMNADGSNVTKLSNNTSDDYEPIWSPDGSKIAFTRGSGCVIVTGNRKQAIGPATEPCTSYVYVMNADGSNPVNVSETAGLGPVWSPNSTQLAYTGTEANEQIYIVNADGTDRIRLTNNDANDHVSSWSPEGSYLAFHSDRDFPPDAYVPEIYVMDVEGSSQVRLTNNQTADTTPIFSPDGSLIAFQRGAGTYSPIPGDDAEIFLMNYDGTNQRNLTDHALDDLGPPVFSPDGLWIAFQSGNPSYGSNPTEDSEIFIVSVAGGNLTNVTKDSADQFGPPSWQTLDYPPVTQLPAIVDFAAANYVVNENAGTVEIVVSRSGDTAEAVVVECDSNDGTASQVSDYTRLFGTLRFAPGETSKSLRVLISDDAFNESTETLSLFLHDVTGNATIAGEGITTVRIIDNDIFPPTTNPLENTQFFVRQHYYDFLNREPDQAGFNFWVNTIESCGTDAACREVRKINTSAAFFLSIEYQQTQFYIYRIYLETLKAHKYLDMVRDAQEISRDVIVGSPGWEQRLDENTQRFTEDFVSSPQFRLNYPVGISASGYVDRLYQNQATFVSPPVAERNQAIAAYGSGDSAGRARALRIAANNATFIQQQFNQAFVLAEYFGYLRRDPDLAGYNFWKSKLDQFNGDFQKAEMVKAFLTSSEYRLRFGP
jgi:Tol biopolymer transport system component